MKNDLERPMTEKPDTFWKRVYVAVVITTVLVVTSLWAFSRYFSS